MFYLSSTHFPLSPIPLIISRKFKNQPNFDLLEKLKKLKWFWKMLRIYKILILQVRFCRLYHFKQIDAFLRKSFWSSTRVTCVACNTRSIHANFAGAFFPINVSFRQVGQRCSCSTSKPTGTKTCKFSHLTYLLLFKYFQYVKKMSCYRKTMKVLISVLTVLSVVGFGIAQFRFPGNFFGGNNRRPAGPPGGGFRTGGGSCTPTPNYQSGGRNFWVSWRTCGTQFQGSQVQGVCSSGGMRPVSLNNPALAQVYTIFLIFVKIGCWHKF